MPVTEALELLRRGRGSDPGRPHDPRRGSPTSGSATSPSASPSTTLSGGERQRLKLAAQMAEKGDVYVLDEPTTGLHLADVDNLLGLLDRLVESGKSVIVIEHHQAVMAHGDWIIDLGPGAGHDGGNVVFEGTPADLVARPAPPSPASTSPPTWEPDRHDGRPGISSARPEDGDRGLRPARQPRPLRPPPRRGQPNHGRLRLLRAWPRRRRERIEGVRVVDSLDELLAPTCGPTWTRCSS